MLFVIERFQLFQNRGACKLARIRWCKRIG